MRIQLDGMVERRLLRPLTPPEQAYMEVLQEIEDDLLQASRLFKEPRAEKERDSEQRAPGTVKPKG